MSSQFYSEWRAKLHSKIGVTALNVLVTLLEYGVGVCFEFSFE